MTETIRTSSTETSAAAHGLSARDCLKLYRIMYTSRRVDDAERKLKSQNKTYFQISGAGHEAVLAALGLVMVPGKDWTFSYYRDRALMLMLGMTPHEMLLDAVGSPLGPSSGGRQMPSHWGMRKFGVATKSSCVGTQFLQAVGCAQAGRLLPILGDTTQDDTRAYDDEFTVVTGGDGSTSEGEFWEAVNLAANTAHDRHAPVLFLVEDNGYAISVPISEQTAGGSIAQAFAGLKDAGLLEIFEVDGCDPVESYGLFRRIEPILRRERRPVLVRAHVIRPYSHSESDDERLYKTDEIREKDKERDPLVTFPRRLIADGIATEEKLSRLRDEVDAGINADIERALAAPRPESGSWKRHLFAVQPDVRGAMFESQPEFSGEPLTLIQAVNKTLFDEMARNHRIVMFGEDVADVGQYELIGQVKGKGGVFKSTIGLQREYGPRRVYNSPLAEATIVGAAVGMAMRGLKPVVEIQFGDYIWPAMMQIVSEMRTTRWRSAGDCKSPAVVRVAVGGYLGGTGAIYHSQSIEGTFAHFPGVWVVMPSNAIDAAGLLRSALRCDDPVLYLEHKRLYRQPALKGQYPGPEYTIPFGRGRIIREGSDITIVTYGATTMKANAASRTLASEDLDVEIIDLRTIVPWDQEIVAESVKKTGRVLVLHEDIRFMGFGAEIASWIGENLFEHLDAPVRRVGAEDVPVSYGPEMEDEILPQQADIESAVRELAAY